jgi:hypothetical protein
MKYKSIREEELKNKVGADWFKVFDTTEILGNIDFTVFPKQDNLFGRTPLLWAEAKTGNFDVTTMFVQLVLTIGKARTFDKTLPPAFLGAFDFKKFAFVPYINIQDIFYVNDFNWNVTPSNHETKEFLLIKERIEAILGQYTFIYDYEKDEKELQHFIKNNIANATTTSKLKIDKNNFIPIYLRWLEIVKPIINVNWDDLKKANVLDSDFYLADLFVDDKNTQQLEDDLTIRDSLFVVFQQEGYKIAKENIKQMFDATIGLKNKETYLQFWKRYKRPPVKEYQDYIIERRDLLVPQDIRERKGAFFTPRIWVELSQKYLTDYLGDSWQEDYYIWDCAAGTGNLLAGLTNKYNIYASTLDQADINVIHERIEHGANLLKNNVFQFDFLNDDFTKLPQSLQDIINDEDKRKRLVIYINPPYAEAGSVNVTDIRKNKSDVSNSSKIWKLYKEKLGLGIRELFVQFYIRINDELKDCKLGSFSKLKYVNGDGFKDFRGIFKPEYINGFIVPADTFDNVKGKFPISFLIWDFHKSEKLYTIKTDVYNKEGIYTGSKNFYSNEDEKRITDWVNRLNIKSQTNVIGYTGNNGPDFQNNNYCLISSVKKINSNGVVGNASKYNITFQNLLQISIYFSVRHCIDATWINDRDQFLSPNDGWQSDSEFQNDCLAFTLFYGQNRIISNEGTNHWIPFTEHEVNAKAKFASNFMTDFIKGKIKKETSGETLFKVEEIEESKPLVFSDEATAVFDAGRELWKYYHSQNDVDINVNASFYDIRAYFQGTNALGRMNARSEDVTYTKLIGELRNKLSVLADKIKPKVYEYEFLKE